MGIEPLFASYSLSPDAGNYAPLSFIPFYYRRGFKQMRGVPLSLHSDMTFR
ncbi:MAG: hypothetical protein ACFCAD_12645 [Pleurocapsa sp.]